MAAGGKKGALAKLRKELQRIGQEPPENIQVSVNERDMLEWHYLLRGPPGTPYDGGWYWGKLKFPPEYPFKPPGIIMHTPSGRFETNMRLCLSMSDYHPETWNPMWSVASVLTGLLSFMTGSDITTGSIETADEEKKRLAARSMAWNVTSPIFVKLFPQAEVTAQRAARGEEVKASGVALAADEEEEEGEAEKGATQEGEKKGDGSDSAGKRSEGEEAAQREAASAGPTGGVSEVRTAEGGARKSEEKREEEGGQRARKSEAPASPGAGEEVGDGGLRVGDEVVISNLVKQAHLNGIRCVVKEVASGGRYRVKPLEGDMKDLLLKAQNLAIDDEE